MKKESTSDVTTLFQWDAPPSNTKVDNYTISVISFTQPMYMRRTVSDKSATIQGLKWNVAYNVSIVAQNCGGTGRSISLSGKTNEDHICND